MAERIVVAFETPLAVIGASSAEQHWRALLALRERAEVRGGNLCALGPRSVAFAFAPEELEEALSLASTADGDGASAAGAAQLHWGVGIAQGEIASLVEGRSVAALGWGKPLVIASALAGCAAAGEVLLDGDLPALQRAEVRTSEMRTIEHPELRLCGALLDARAAYASVPPRAASVRCRALLAQAVAIARAGRATESLFVSLEALARAREARDARGERACLHFLARLTSAAGYQALAQRWATTSSAMPATPGRASATR